jgi:hypothetical protein
MPVRRGGRDEITEIRHGRMLKYSSTRAEEKGKGGICHDKKAEWRREKNIEKRQEQSRPCT